MTFLFTDIESSTRLWDEHAEVMRTALVRHDEILRAAVRAVGGFIFSTGGDGIAAAFHRAGDGVAAAVEAQRALLAEGWPEHAELRVRIGVHTGEALERDGDYFGPPVNRAARLMRAAHGGQVVVSYITAGLCGSMADLEFIDLGGLRLRGVTEALHAFGVSADGLAWLHRPLATAGTVAGNLNDPITEWFGSVSDLHGRVASLAKRRVVTLTGPGGVGKTRLATELGLLAADEFTDGVWMVELGRSTAPTLLWRRWCRRWRSSPNAE